MEGALVLAKGAHVECLVVEPLGRGFSLVVGLDRASLQGSTGPNEWCKHYRWSMSGMVLASSRLARDGRKVRKTASASISVPREVT